MFTVERFDYRGILSTVLCLNLNHYCIRPFDCKRIYIYIKCSHFTHFFIVEIAFTNSYAVSGWDQDVWEEKFFAVKLC